MKLEKIIKLKLNNFNIEAPSTVTQGEVTTNRKPINFADYPWDECIDDQLNRGYDEESANNICGWIKANYQQMAEGDGLESACWPGYEAIGTKELDGRTVPNCVPIKEEQSKQKFVIPTPEKDEEQDKYISRCISSIIDEYGQEQASAICYGQWDKK
jgi:hypothetical protein